MKEKPLSDKDIKTAFNIPISTLQDFKNSDKNNWRYKIYHFIKDTFHISNKVENAAPSSKELELAYKYVSLKVIFEDKPNKELLGIIKGFLADNQRITNINFYNYNEVLFSEIKTDFINLIIKKEKEKEISIEDSLYIIKIVSKCEINEYLILIDIIQNIKK